RLVGLVPPRVGHARAGEVDRRVGTVDDARVQRFAVGAPAHVVRPGGVPPDQAYHLVSGSPEALGQSRPQVAGRACDDDAHDATAPPLPPAPYSPTSASKWPVSSRSLMVARNRAASAPSTSR